MIRVTYEDVRKALTTRKPTTRRCPECLGAQTHVSLAWFGDEFESSGCPLCSGLGEIPIEDNNADDQPVSS